MQFEYKIFDDKDGINPDDERELNWLGEQGWELTAIGRSHSEFGGARYYFKRSIDKPRGKDRYKDE